MDESKQTPCVPPPEDLVGLHVSTGQKLRCFFFRREVRLCHCGRDLGRDRTWPCWRKEQPRLQSGQMALGRPHGRLRQACRRLSAPRLLQAAMLFAGMRTSTIQGALPVGSSALLQRIAVAGIGDTIPIPHDFATEAVSIALHAGLNLRGEPRPCPEFRSDDALPGPCKDVDLPEVRAQDGRVSAFQISAPPATRLSISNLRLRHNGGPCDHEGPANTWGLSLEEAAAAVEAREPVERQQPAAALVQESDAVSVDSAPAASSAHSSHLGTPQDRAVDQQEQRVDKALNDMTDAGTALLPSPTPSLLHLSLPTCTSTPYPCRRLNSLAHPISMVVCAGCCVGVDSGVFLIEACIVSATNGTALGVMGQEARITIDQCQIKDSAFGLVCVLGARLSCSRSLFSSLTQAAIVTVGNGSLCELECNTVRAGAGAYGMSVTEGAKAVLEGNSFTGARQAGLSISGKL